MKTVLAVVLLCAIPLTAQARYVDDILKPWIGATQDELVAKWGYPQSANDLIKIDDDTVVYSYRSFRSGWGGPAACVVSFTLKSKKVVYWKYEGGNCPPNKRE